MSGGATGTASTSFWVTRPDGAQRGARRRAGGHAVINHDRNVSTHLGADARTEVEAPAPFDLGEFALANGVKLPFGDASHGDHVLVAHDQRSSSIRHGAHREFRLERNPYLADKDQIQRSIHRHRDGSRDRNAPARQGQHDDVFTLVFDEFRGETVASFQSIIKGHGRIPFWLSLRHCASVARPTEPAVFLKKHIYIKIDPRKTPRQFVRPDAKAIPAFMRRRG